MSYYISQAVAKALDEELFRAAGVVQLMEVAGLTVAQVAMRLLGDEIKGGRALVVCGPGNNGGDGLVAAKYLKVFGCGAVDFCVVKRGSNAQLAEQARSYGCVELEGVSFEGYSMIVDGIFGFGYKKRAGENNVLLDKLVEYSKEQKRGVILSIDVPSGWSVDECVQSGSVLEPDCIVSLTAPKLCTKSFGKRHYLGGRFVPEVLLEKYGLGWVKELYKGHELFVEM